MSKTAIIVIAVIGVVLYVAACSAVGKFLGWRSGASTGETVPPPESDDTH